jgi:hypothetical protein
MFLDGPGVREKAIAVKGLARVAEGGGARIDTRFRFGTRRR